MNTVLILILVIVLMLGVIAVLYRGRAKWKAKATRTAEEKTVLKDHQEEVEKIISGHREIVKEVDNAPNAEAARAVAHRADDDWNAGL